MNVPFIYIQHIHTSLTSSSNENPDFKTKILRKFTQQSAIPPLAQQILYLKAFKSIPPPTHFLSFKLFFSFYFIPFSHYKESAYNNFIYCSLIHKDCSSTFKIYIKGEHLRHLFNLKENYCFALST